MIAWKTTEIAQVDFLRELHNSIWVSRPKANKIGAKWHRQSLIHSFIEIHSKKQKLTPEFSFFFCRAVGIRNSTTILLDLSQIQ